MKFSLSQLLALVVLAAFGMVAWRARSEVQREQVRVVQLVGDVQRLEQDLMLGQPAMQQHEADLAKEYESLASLRTLSEAHYDVLLDKYGGLQPAGEQIVSIRQIPSLITQQGEDATSFRVWVPQQREVWLKFGVWKETDAGTSGMNTSSGLDKRSDWSSELPIQHSGPFERRLPPGDHVVTITTRSENDGFPLAVTLNKQPLLQLVSDSSDFRAVGWSTTAFPSQFDIKPSRSLPWLMSVKLALPDPDTDSNENAYCRGSIWLSDQANDFGEYPGE